MLLSSTVVDGMPRKETDMVVELSTQPEAKRVRPVGCPKQAVGKTKKLEKQNSSSFAVQARFGLTLIKLRPAAQPTPPLWTCRRHGPCAAVVVHDRRRARFLAGHIVAGLQLASAVVHICGPRTGLGMLHIAFRSGRRVH